MNMSLVLIGLLGLMVVLVCLATRNKPSQAEMYRAYVSNHDPEEEEEEDNKHEGGDLDASHEKR